MITILIQPDMVKRIAGLELNALMQTKTLKPKLFNGAKVISIGTPIYDINGEKLFQRVPIMKDNSAIAYADIALHSAFGAPLIAVNQGLDWNLRRLTKIGSMHAMKHKVEFDEIRIVAYSYPKLAMQYLLEGKEVLMLELHSWLPVPPLDKDKKEPVTGFERWSYIGSIPDTKKQQNMDQFNKRITEWDKFIPDKEDFKFKFEVLDFFDFKERIEHVQFWPLFRQRELHYNTDNNTHFTCYELIGQETNVWCVAASVQMLLDFYRYNYEQTRIADELGLGTLDNPNGLPYSRDGDVVTVIENLTSNALDANMNTSPTFQEFKNEINANRPIISFIPRHSRTVAGYTESRIISWLFFRGLLVYDPWPPNVGTISRWENFDAITYRVTFTAHLTLV